jgi:hypothetical protein
MTVIEMDCNQNQGKCYGALPYLNRAKGLVSLRSEWLCTIVLFEAVDF